MEDGLGEPIHGETVLRVWRCLNPCFSGGWSRSSQTDTPVVSEVVLILVLVEDGLGGCRDARADPRSDKS